MNSDIMTYSDKIYSVCQKTNTLNFWS